MQRPAQHHALVATKVEQQAFIVTDDFDVMQERLLELITHEATPATQIALNATGGTKWMAIAAQEVFRLNDSPVFYVDVAQDQILYLDKNRKAHKLTQSIDLKSYIQSYGYEIRESSKPVGLPSQLRELCQQLVANVDSWQGALGQLNLLASVADQKKTLRIHVADTLGRQGQNPQLPALLRECEYADLLKEEGGQLIFATAALKTFSQTLD